jgi:hypothetical protein
MPAAREKRLELGETGVSDSLVESKGELFDGCSAEVESHHEQKFLGERIEKRHYCGH